MRMKTRSLFLMVFLAVIASACAGTPYSFPIPTQDGTLTIAGRTGVFGTDGLAILYEEKKPAKAVPDNLTLQKSWSRQATIQEYDQKCPDPKQLKNIHTRTENISESWDEEVPNPHKRPPQKILFGGTNPSTGNIAIPAAISGGSYVGGNAVAPGVNNVISAVNTAKGGKGGQGGAGGQGGQGGGSNVEFQPHITTSSSAGAISGSNSTSGVNFKNQTGGTNHGGCN